MKDISPAFDLKVWLLWDTIKKNKIQNTKSGITLLALIVTVIILLILATVSISLVINNGILNKAKSAVDKYSKEEELEQIKLAFISAQLKGNGFLTTENLNSELQAHFNNTKTVERKESSEYYNYKANKIFSRYYWFRFYFSCCIYINQW